MIISWFRDITSVYIAIVIAKADIVTITMTLSFEGQSDQERSKQYQKWIQHTQISWIRCITHVYVLYNKNDKVFIMGDGGYIWFGHDVIRGGVPNKHLGDFSCPETH